MPIFDNELSVNTSEQPKIPQAPLGSPELREVNTGMGGFENFGQGEPAKTGMGLEDLSKVQVGNTSSFDSPFQLIPRQELLDNKRYSFYERGVDLENIHGLNQSSWAQLGNSIVKMIDTAIGTFAQSFAMLPDHVKAIKTGKLSELTGGKDGYEGDIDIWLRNIEDKFPNYMTRKEQEHPFLAAIPGFAGSANFWGNMVIKNIGFTIGAIGGALVQDAAIGFVTGGIGDIFLLSAQVGKAALFLNKIFTGVKDIDKVLDLGREVGAAGKIVLNSERLAQLAAATKITNGFRYGLNIYGSAWTEAGVEARDGHRQVKDTLMAQYKTEHLGMEPTAEDLQMIDTYATDAMNVRFGINMALLTVSNIIQFDNLFKSFGKASAGLTSGVEKRIADAGKIGLKEGSIDIFEKKVAATLPGKIWDSVKPKLPMIISEGVYEEGGQYAAERGTYDYYTRKYKNLKDSNNLANWNTVNETVNSTTYGLMEQFGTTEGVQNMFVGAIIAMITGAGMNLRDSMKGQGKNARLTSAINMLNQYGLTGTLSEKYTDTLNTVGIAKEMEDAVKSGDIFKFKNLKHDMFFKYVVSRIPSGMHDVTIEQLKMLKDLSKEAFEKTFGMDFNESNKKTVDTYVDSIIEKANDIKSVVDGLDKTFKNPFTNHTDPKEGSEQEEEKANYDTFNSWKTDLAHYASIAPNINGRLDSINTELAAIHPLLGNDVVSKFTSRSSLKELANQYTEKANELNLTLSQTTVAADKKSIKKEIDSLRTMAQRAGLILEDGLKLKSISELLNFELNNQDGTKDAIIPIDKTLDIIKYSTAINNLNKRKREALDSFNNLADKDGFEKYFEQAKTMAAEEAAEIEVENQKPAVAPPVHMFKNAAGVNENIEVNREYETLAPKEVKPIKRGKNWIVTDPKTGIKHSFDVKANAQDKADEVNAELAAIKKVRVLKLNPDGTIKVEDQDGNIYDLNPNQLAGYKKIQSQEEKLQKNKEDIDKQQDQLILNSGDTSTGDPLNDKDAIEDGLIKDANIFFISGISESEDYNDPTQSAQHVKNSREFLNNAKKFKNRDNLRAILVTPNNEESLGLKGLTQMSYGTKDLKGSTDVNLGFIAQVFVEQDGIKVYFVDKTGKRLGMVGQPLSDISEVIFQTMPTIATTTSKGTARFRKDQKDLFKAKRDAWAKKRTQIFNQPKGQFQVYEFIISRGIPNIGKEENHVGGILVPEEVISGQQGLIQISVSGMITHNGNSLQFSKGRPVLQYHDTLQFLNNKKFSADQSKTIFEVIKALADDIIKQSNANKAVKLNVDYITFLQNVLHYVKTSPASANQIFLDTTTMMITLGKQKYAISEIAANEERILTQLQDTFHNINKTLLKPENFNKPFPELVYKDGVLTDDKIWKNYQTYLLSSKETDGSPRSIENTPLTTNVVKATPEVPYSFKQKYATMNEIDLPIQEIKAPVAPVVPSSTVIKIGDFEANNGKVNTYTEFNKRVGPVDFTLNMDSQRDFSIEVVSNDSITKMANDAPFLASIVDESKKAKIPVEGISDEQIVMNLIKSMLIVKLITIRDKERAAEELAKKEAAEKATKEAAEVITPEVKPEVDISQTTTPDDPFRRVGEHESPLDRMTEADLAIFKEWAAEKLPKISYELLERLIDTYDNEKAYGVFENGMVKFFRGATRGTEYHEMMEAVWKVFLSPEERQALIDEFRTSPGSFTDRQSNKTYKKDDITISDQMVKERIMDDFSEFRLGKLPARSLGEKILRFFRSILDWFKNLGSKPSLIHELFNAIEAGKFKEYTISERVKTETPEYRKIEGITETQAFEYVQDMTAQMMGYLFGENNKKALFQHDKLTGKQLYNSLVQAYIRQGKYQQFEKVGKNVFNELFKRTRENLRTLGINFSDEDVVSINSAESENRSYAAEAFSVDHKKYSPFAIKIVASTLPVTKAMNQEKSDVLESPERKTSSVKGFMLNNFSRVFATLMDKLSNTSSIYKTAEKLVALAKYDSNYVRFFQRVGGNLTTGEFNFKDFKAEDWRLFINFYQTFTKQRPDALIQYVSADETWIAGADQFTASKELQKDWFENMRRLSKDPTSPVTYNAFTKTYQIKKIGLPIKLIADKIAYLNALGIDYKVSDYTSLNKTDKDKFNKAVEDINAYLQVKDDIGTLKGKTLGISAQLRTLADLHVKVNNPNQENVHLNVKGTKSQSYEDNNVISVFENEMNEAPTLADLIETRPELNDIFSKHSIVLMKDGQFYNADGKRIKDFKVLYIEGKKDLDKDKGIATTNLSTGERYVQEINQNLNGNYYILVPADSSTEWMINLGNSIEFTDIQNKKGWNKVYNTFKGYLIDDVALALDYKDRESLRAIEDRARELRFFKDILDEKTLGAIDTMIYEGATQEAIEEYINKNIDAVNQSIKEYIEGTIVDLKEALITSGQVTINKDESYTFRQLDDKFVNNKDRINLLNKFKLEEEDLENILTYINVNYIINNIELHKIIFGDPYQFAIVDGKMDETKRVKSFLSPRRTTVDSEELNNFLNDEYNKVGDVYLTYNDPGYHLHQSHINTVTLQDVKLRHPFFKKAYDETDGISILMDCAYREIKFKNGQWSDEADAFHQWHMAYTRQNFPGYEYVNEELKAHDKALIKTKEPNYTIEVMKPIVSGVKFDEKKINLVLDKFSQMPIYFKMVQGTNLEKLYIKMWNQSIDYAVFASGRKVGAEKSHTLYNSDASFNDAEFEDDMIVQVPWKAYGIQVENSYEHPHHQTRGSQVTKMVTLDMFDNGVALSPAAEVEYKRNVDLLNKIHENAFNELITRLGLEDRGSYFELVDPKAISESLEYEMLRREVSENVKDAIQRDENGEFRIPFEASPAYKQIKDILYSMIHKSLVSLKTSGGPKVQVPVTLWENAKEGRGLIQKTESGYKKITTEDYNKLSDDDKKTVRLSSDTLKFYTKKDPYCEVLLPHWFKDSFDSKRFPTDESILKYLNSTAEGKSILRGVGFRIPTQSMSSIEVFRVKGFLPRSMGDTIVVPSEIVAKAGSDFDIDKMNTYLKSVYVDEKGNVRLIRYQGSEVETKKFFSDVFSRTILVDIKKIQKYDEFRDTLLDIFETLESEEMDITEDVSILSEEQYEFFDYHRSMIMEIISQAEQKDLSAVDYLTIQIDRLGNRKNELKEELLSEALRTEFVNNMYKKSLENEYYDSLEKLLTLPENFDRMMSPVDDAGLAKDANELNKLRGKDDSLIKNKLLNRTYMSTLRHSFVAARRWIGIAAVNITGQSLTQKSKVVIEPSRFKDLTKPDRDILGDGKVMLDHNEVDGKISISGTKTFDGKQYISDRLSGYATAFVDVAKDPYIMDIISSDLAVGIFMFLERIGCGKQTIMFMNQPIIREYLAHLDSLNYKYLYKKANIDAILNKFPTTQNDIIDAQVDVTRLGENIQKYATEKFNIRDNAEQHIIFKEFLKYSKMAEFSFDMTQASNYDTTKFNSSDSFYKKKTKTEVAEKNIFSSVTELLNSNFIGRQKDILDGAMSSMGAIIKLEQNQFKDIIAPIMKVYETNRFLGKDDFDKLAGKVNASLLDYAIQLSELNSKIYELFVGPDSVADQLEKAKIATPEIKILQDLKTRSSDREDGAKTVVLGANIKDAYNENLYTEMMRELKEINPRLYNNIITLAILQGSYQSAFSIKNIIPVEDYARIVKPIIEALNSSPELDMFSKGIFQRANWKDNLIMPVFNPRFFEREDMLEYTEWGDEISTYGSYNFASIPEFGNSTERKILLISAKYNPMDIRNDYVKIPRTIAIGKHEQIDLLTGRTITSAKFKRMKEAGDLSLKDYFGYQKVKDLTGEPLITSKGEYVYKLINLWGDGYLAAEYYSDNRQSVINNGSMKTDEIPDAALIDYFQPKVGEKVVEEAPLFSQLGPTELLEDYSQKTGGTVDKTKVTSFPKAVEDVYNQEKQGELYQETGRSLATLSPIDMNKLESTVHYELLQDEKNDRLSWKVAKPYVVLTQKTSSNILRYLEKSRGTMPIQFEDDYIIYIKSNQNKKSLLYNIIDKKTGEILREKVRVYLNDEFENRDAKTNIADSYGLNFTPTKVYSANRSIAFALYRQLPSKAKYIAQAKKYLYDAIKMVGKQETGTNPHINLEEIENLLNAFPNDMWNYINTTFSPEDSTSINASTSVRENIRFNLPKLGLIQTLETITGKTLIGKTFIAHDRSGALQKKLRVEWGDTVTIDPGKLTAKQLRAATSYYLHEQGYFKSSSEEQNVIKYAEHHNQDYNKLYSLVYGDIENALDNIAYNTTGNSDTMELSKWRESIRNYDWQTAELFQKPYEEFQKQVTQRITDKFKDKKLSNGQSHLDFFFSGNFNWLNINFNNVSGEYFKTEDNEEVTVQDEVGIKQHMTHTGTVITEYNKPIPGKHYLQEKEVYNRLAAVLHEPFHALHALSYGTPKELELRAAFDKLANTTFGKEMLNQVFAPTDGSRYSGMSMDMQYKEFTAFATQLILYPKQWINKTDLRSNDIYEFVEKIQTLQDKIYTEIVKTDQKVGETEKEVGSQEEIKLNFLEKLYNYIVEALNKIIPLSKKFIKLLETSYIVKKTIVEDLFGTTEQQVTRTVRLPDAVRKAKEEFIDSMDEFKSAINSMMDADTSAFNSENVKSFFTQHLNQEAGKAKSSRLDTIKASPKTIGMLKEFTKRIGVDIKGLNQIVVNGVKLDDNGAALLMQKLIQVVNGKEAEALPEEAMHFAVAIIKQTNPAMYKQLMNEINQYKLLDEVFTEYGSDPLYQNADGKPNEIKLKEEAIAKVLAETIIKHAENLSEKSGLLEKTHSWWNSIINFFKTLFGKSGFDQLSLDIISGKEIGTAEDINEKADATFLQKGSQESIMDQLDNISNKIELKADSYYIMGVKILRRVSELVNDWYARRFADKNLTKSEYQVAVDDLKAEEGTAGHAAIDYAFDILVDEKGYIRDQALDDSNYETDNPGFKRDMYELLKKNLEQRLYSFPKGTRFKSEIIVYDAKRSIAGTIDFLAVEPSGKVHILDWKFMTVNLDKIDPDVPWYKVNAWHLQMTQYKLILQNAYGIKSEDFGQTRMIPIYAHYTPGNAKLNVLPKLDEIKIGDVNVKNIQEAYLLPVGLESEKTGNKNVDKLLEKLNAMYKRFSDKKVLPSEKMNKAEQLNKLFTAIRQLQIKGNLKPLLIQAKVLNMQIQNIIATYHSKYEGKDPTIFDDKDINNFAAELLTAIEAVQTYTNLSIDLKSLFPGTLSPEDQKLKDSLRDTTDEAQEILNTLYDVIDNFVQNTVAKSEGVDRLLAPEKIVKGITKLFSSTSTLQLKSIEVLYKKANKSFAFAGMDTMTENMRLEDYKKNYESWAQRKGLSRKNFFDILKKKNSNELIDEYNPEFYKTLKQKISEKDIQWIKDNINVTEYKQKIADLLTEELKRIDDKPRVGTDEENAREVSMEKYIVNQLYNTSTDDSVGWLLYDYALKFPKDSWKSKEWIELSKPENTAAKDFYDYIIEKNNEYMEIGYITNPRIFLPYVRKGLTERLATGGQVKILEQTLRNVTIDEGDVGYGQRDPLTGRPVDTIPKYFTSKIEGELSEDLFRNMSMYNESAIRYKYLTEIEDQVRAIAAVERNKKAIDTSYFGKTIYKDGEIQYSNDNSENSKLFEDMMKGIIYGQKYVTSETFDQVLGKIGNWGATLNKKLGVDIFPEDLEGRQLSVNKVITQFNNTFQLATLGFNVLSASSNLFGGNIHSMINAGTYFTKTDYIAAEGMLFMKMLGGTDKQKMVGALEYFLPLTENYNREFTKGLSLSKMNSENVQDALMFLMRHSDLNVQMSNFYAYLNNTIVQDGKVINARQYLRSTDKYADKYAGTPEQRRSLDEEFEKEVKDLILSKGVLKVATVIDGKFTIPGVEQKSQSVVELRRKVQQISKDALGNLSEDDLRKINMQVLGKSIMVFKNWIPRLVDVRMGNMKYNSASDAYEWGRMRMVMRILNDGVFSSLSRFRNAWLGNDKGVEYMRTLFEKKKADYENDTGKTLNMTEAEFLDLVRKNIKSQAIDLTIMLSLVGLVLALKAYSPPDDEDPAVKSQYRFMVRAIDKFKDELSYFYNLSSVTGLLSMGFPAMTLVNNIEKGFTHFFIENWAIATGNEKLEKSNQVIKYWMKTFPIANQMVGYLPMFYPELAKDMGVKIQANYGIR